MTDGDPQVWSCNARVISSGNLPRGRHDHEHGDSNFNFNVFPAPLSPHATMAADL
jgi:hypothetical protein